jgi:hypothetical protein
VKSASGFKIQAVDVCVVLGPIHELVFSGTGVGFVLRRSPGSHGLLGIDRRTAAGGADRRPTATGTADVQEIFSELTRKSQVPPLTQWVTSSGCGVPLYSIKSVGANAGSHNSVPEGRDQSYAPI